MCDASALSARVRERWARSGLITASCGGRDTAPEAQVVPAGCAEPAAPVEVTGPAPELSSAGDWPSANRDLSGTRAASDSLIDSATVSDLETVWEYPLTGTAGFFGYAATNPLILGGPVYLQDLASGLHVLDLQTGRVCWRLALDAPVFGPNGLAVGWGRVFAPTRGRAISAYDAAQGELLWETDLVAAGGAVNIQPVLAGQLVLAATSSLSQPGSRGHLFALDPQTGDVVWAFDTIESPDLWGNPQINSGEGAWYPPAVDLDAGLVFWGILQRLSLPRGPGLPERHLAAGRQSLDGRRSWRSISPAVRSAGASSTSPTTSSIATVSSRRSRRWRGRTGPRASWSTRAKAPT